MRSRMRNSFEVLGMSALDLFASALGVFVLLVFVLLPFYLRQPTLEAETTGAAAELSALSRELALARARLVATQSERREAEERLASAQRRLAAAPAPRPEAARAAEAPPPAPSKKPGAIAIPPLDLVIAIDTTGSMRDEIAELQAGIFGIIRILNRLSPSLAVGIVAFRDEGEEYVTRVHPLETMNEAALQKAIAFVDSLNARGGGDDPEAVDTALAAAMKLGWREGVMGRLIVIGDQPPHPERIGSALDLARGHYSAKLPGRSVGAIFAGRAESPARRFFEELARAGGGDFRVHRGEMIESILLSVLESGQKP